MSQPSKAICVQITGRDSSGADFNEMAWIDQCGNFGTIIYTPIRLNLGDRLYICNPSGEVAATAEVVWRRVGESPALEVLLKRGCEVINLPPIPTQIRVEDPPVKEQLPIPEKRQEIPAKAQTEEIKQRQPVKSQSGSQEQRPPSPTVVDKQNRPSDSQKRRPPSPTVEVEKRKPIDPLQLERQATLEQFRKIGIVATIVCAIFLVVLLSPIGKPEPTRFHLLQQRDCVEANSLGGQSANQKGELEFWSEDQNGQIFFFRRDDMTPPEAIEEMNKQVNLGNRVAGLWCSKEDSRLVEDAGSSALPNELSANWSLLPVGKNATQASKINFYVDSTRLIFQEDGVDRTQDVVNAIYYEGAQKLVIKLNDMATTGTKAAVKELKFYLPRAKVSAVAESRLADSTWQSYTASSNPRPTSIDLRFIATLAVAVLLLFSAGYVVVNLIQSRR